jgi:hypothetical protein
MQSTVKGRRVGVRMHPETLLQLERIGQEKINFLAAKYFFDFI